MFYFRHPVQLLVGILGERAVLSPPCSYLVHHFIIAQQIWGDLSYGLDSVVAISFFKAGRIWPPHPFPLALCPFDVTLSVSEQPLTGWTRWASHVLPARSLCAPWHSPLWGPWLFRKQRVGAGDLGTAPGPLCRQSHTRSALTFMFALNPADCVLAWSLELDF